MLRRLALSLLAPTLVLSGLALVGPAGPAAAAQPAPVEDYASYDGPRACKPKAQPGTLNLRAWTVATYGGGAGGTSRACRGKPTSEHQEGRAFDWTVQATRKADRVRVNRWLAALLATGPSGEAHELARRMGVMYVIWNDKMYASYRQFAPTPYVYSSCRGKPLKKCSATFRHRDHVHVSLSRAGAQARTSWYATPQARRYR